jgi:hypothetical protein
MLSLLAVPVVGVVPAPAGFPAEVSQDVEVVAAAAAREDGYADQIALGRHEGVVSAAEGNAIDAGGESAIIYVAGNGIARDGSGLGLAGRLESQHSDGKQTRAMVIVTAEANASWSLTSFGRLTE